MLYLFIISSIELDFFTRQINVETLQLLTQKISHNLNRGILYYD